MRNVAYHYDEENEYGILNGYHGDWGYLDDSEINPDWGNPFEEEYDDFYEDDDDEEWEEEDKQESIIESNKELVKEEYVLDINDRLEQYENQLLIGKKGEEFVYKYELNKLRESKYQRMIDPRKADNPCNGYDILSYELDSTPLHIEVKTSISDTTFQITAHEIETAKRMEQLGLKYVIYLVNGINTDYPSITVLNNIFDVIRLRPTSYEATIK
jgi:hypothetical protein